MPALGAGSSPTLLTALSIAALSARVSTADAGRYTPRRSRSSVTSSVSTTVSHTTQQTKDVTLYQAMAAVPVSGLSRSKELTECGHPTASPLRTREYRAAQEYGPKFWLYVVEHVRGPTGSVVLPIPHPIAAITEYRFDDGWRILVEPSAAATSLQPAVGLIATIDAGVEAVIAQVDSRGQLSRLHLRLSSGEVIVRTYSPAMALRRPVTS